MSFSGQIKEELYKVIPQARHCQLAELAAIIKFCNKETAENSEQIVISYENELVVRKCFTLLKKTYNIEKEFLDEEPVYAKKGSYYVLTLDDKELVRQLRTALSNTTLTQSACCRRAYIRGAFLAIGSVSDPAKSYHLEYVFSDVRDAESLMAMLAVFDVDAKIILRKKYYVLYIKDGTQIVDVLNIMGAHLALMDFENARIVKEVRNSVNRKFNCEMANLDKTVAAASKQAESIQRLMSAGSLYRNLPDSLKEMAELRLNYPEASLKELAEMADPPLSKSCVNHRLRKLNELAETVNEQQ